MNPQYYQSLFNAPRPSDHPNWSQDVTTAIDNIFEHLLELARSLEALETRIAALEAATPAPQEEPTP
jgi:hypothetical protein